MNLMFSVTVTNADWSLVEWSFALFLLAVIAAFPFVLWRLMRDADGNLSRGDLQVVIFGALGVVAGAFMAHVDKPFRVSNYAVYPVAFWFIGAFLGRLTAPEPG